MELISDILLVSGALGAGFYCHVLSRRLRQFTDLERGVGGAVTALSTQVSDLSTSVLAAQETAQTSVSTLGEVSERAEAAARHLELLVAAMHDLPQDQTPPVKKPNPFRVGTGEQAPA
ncbi:hypothetical protein AN189_00610 [Loktanella sp. 3ANDIMAR09]|uniref:hypothetical protein n=1 Tax=Loktanella sp. 3ANDIMAR09 TaxID=1225657 RepID=UPI0006FB8816|nr:hypothetical protein [Loktanella sp. 3ANDIMAR09]KQI69950.1 hypothetical protein AN189_00610 [Loktanella sp. 3ANDIMAR09]